MFYLLFPQKPQKDKSRRTAEAPQGVWSGVIVCVLGGPTETASTCAVVTDTGYLCPASPTPIPHARTHPMHTLAATISSPPLRHYIHYLHAGFLRLLCRGQPVSSGTPSLWSLWKNTSISPFRHPQLQDLYFCLLFSSKTWCLRQRQEFRWKVSVCLRNR